MKNDSGHTRIGLLTESDVELLSPKKYNMSSRTQSWKISPRGKREYWLSFIEMVAIRMDLKHFNVVVIACIVGNISSSLASDRASTKEIVFPEDTSIGAYNIWGMDEPKRMTEREVDELNKKGTVLPDLDGGEIRGKVRYPADRGLGIVISGANPEIVAEKLESIRRFPADDIHGIFIDGECNLASLRILSTFRNLRDITMRPSSALEEEQGCRYLKALQFVEYFGTLKHVDYVFGSTRFCETMLGWKRLKCLGIPCEKLRESDVLMLAAHPSLDRLFLVSKRPVCGRKALHALSRMTQLRELRISCTPDVTDADFMPFAELKRLELLSVATEAALDVKTRLEARNPDCTFAFYPLSDVE